MSSKTKEFLKKTTIFWVLVLLIVIMAFLSPAFLKGRNVANIVKQISINGILAVGMTMVIITGGIDLSVGSVVALSSITAAFFGTAEKDYPAVIAVLMAVLVGVIVGLINGIGVAYIGFPAFIVTLSTMTIVRGLALIVTNGVPIFGLSDSMINLANGTLANIPNLVFYLLAVFIVGIVLLNFTVFGRHLYSVGGNSEAANSAGIHVNRILTVSYCISVFCAGLAGALAASRITSGNPTTGEGYEMNAISAAVIGGVSMSGGKGGLFGTLIGALLIGVMQNGLDILGVSSYYQKVIQGLIILVAVFFDIRGNKEN